jgi:hypothetical protein
MKAPVQDTHPLAMAAHALIDENTELPTAVATRGSVTAPRLPLSRNSVSESNLSKQRKELAARKRQ